MGKEKNIDLVGTYDYEKPRHPEMGWGNKTFSVGIYQWLMRANGKSLKKSKTIVRVSGPVEKPESVYSKADEIRDQLNGKSYTGKSNVSVR